MRRASLRCIFRGCILLLKDKQNKGVFLRFAAGFVFHANGINVKHMEPTVCVIFQYFHSIRPLHNNTLHY